MEELTIIGGAVAASVTFILGLFGVGIKWLWDKLEPRIDHTLKTLDTYADKLQKVAESNQTTADNQQRLERQVDQMHSALVVAIEAHRAGSTEGGLRIARAVLERRRSRRESDQEELRRMLNNHPGNTDSGQ